MAKITKDKLIELIQESLEEYMGGSSEEMQGADMGHGGGCPMDDEPMDEPPLDEPMDEPMDDMEEPEGNREGMYENVIQKVSSKIAERVLAEENKDALSEIDVDALTERVIARILKEKK